MGGVKLIKPKPWLGPETANFSFKFNNNRKVFEKDHDVVLELVLAEDFKGFRMVETLRDLSVSAEQPENWLAGYSDQRILLTSMLVNVDPVPLAELPAKEYVFVVDCSGGMRGERIEEAKKTLQSLINSLPVGSKFNVVRFGTIFGGLFDTPEPCNIQNKKKAIELAMNMKANLGGTRLFECLKSVLEDERSIKAFKRQIFVITDGGIKNQDETLKLVADNSNENRVFSFGIGSGCSTALVNGLAEQGKGSASFIKKSAISWDREENLSEICIKSIMASASQHVSKIEVTPVEGLLAPLDAPKSELSMVVDNTCLNVFHLDVNAEVALRLTKVTNEEKITTEIMAPDLEILPSPFEPNALHKLVAKKRISQMVNEIKAIGFQPHPADPIFLALKKEIIDISIKEQVLSPYTALVGVADETTVIGISQRVDVGIRSSRPRTEIGAIQSSRPHTQIGAKSVAFGSESCSTSTIYGGTTREVHVDGRTFILENTEGTHEKKYRPPASDCLRRPRPAQNRSRNRSGERKLVAADSRPSAVEPDFSEVLRSELLKPELSNTHQTVSNAQDPEGFWSDLASIGLAPGLLSKILKIYTDVKVVGTIYALILLISRFGEAYDEWKLSAVKGCGYLKRELGPDAAEKIKSIDGVSIDEEMLDKLF